jgi:mannonate dehydratase
MNKMRVAVGQFRELRDEDLVFAKQIGVSGVSYNSIDFASPAMRRALGTPDYTGYVERPYWAEDELTQLREAVEEHGLTLESLENVPGRMMRDIRTAGPERDREIDAYCKTIENMGRAGIPILGYNFMILPVLRTSRTAPGRGGAHCTAFDRAKAIGADGTEPLALGRRVEADEVWERFTYFISRVLPVAESAGVKLALHPDDPPVKEAYGVARIFGDLPGHRRALEEIAPSPMHGLDFCCGSWAESGVEKMYEALEYFSSRGKVFYVHFRNVQGAGEAFQESFVDDGDFDVVRTIGILKRTGFDGFIIDDHVPHMPGDTEWAHRGRAYATGFIKGLVTAAAA